MRKDALQELGVLLHHVLHGIRNACQVATWHLQERVVLCEQSARIELGPLLVPDCRGLVEGAVAEVARTRSCMADKIEIMARSSFFFVEAIFGLRL